MKSDDTGNKIGIKHNGVIEGMEDCGSMDSAIVQETLATHKEELSKGELIDINRENCYDKKR